MKKLISIIAVMLCCTIAFSQPKEFKGVLTIKDVGIPIEGATVKVKSNKTVTTNHKGVFFVMNPKFPLRITFSLKGYTKTTVIAKDAKQNSFTMEAGSQLVKENEDKTKGKKRGSASSSSEVELSKGQVTYSSILDRLRAVPGVQIKGDQIIIRGKSSINVNNGPLIVIDGVLSTNNILNSGLDPNDIKSIRVLKGADTSAYGMRGAAGVIEIKTRSSAE